MIHVDFASISALLSETNFICEPSTCEFCESDDRVDIEQEVIRQTMTSVARKFAHRLAPVVRDVLTWHRVGIIGHTVTFHMHTPTLTETAVPISTAIHRRRLHLDWFMEIAHIDPISMLITYRLRQSPPWLKFLGWRFERPSFADTFSFRRRLLDRYLRRESFWQVDPMNGFIQSCRMINFCNHD